MSTNPDLLSVVPKGTVHRVQGLRAISFPSVTVDILATRKIQLSEWRLRRFADPYWRLYWPLETGAAVEIDGEETTLQVDHLYLIPPHTVFSTRLRKPFTKWYAHFKLGRMADRAAPGIYALKKTQSLKEMILALEDGPQDSAFPWHTVDLVTHALRLLPSKVWMQHKLDQRILKALDFMSDHLALKLSAEQIAKHSGVSIRTLNYLFRNGLGQSPIRILLDYRLDEACRMLRTGDASIEAIAEECGLVNRHYFSRMMRQYRQTSPAAYRSEQSWT